jgi:hypothetical protein
MKRHILQLTSLITALFLTSCFEIEQTINLKKDGSGTIVEQVLLGSHMLDMPPEQLNGMFTQAEEKAKTRPAKLGEGVTFDKFEKINDGKTKGWRSTYKYTDINKVLIPSEIEMEVAGQEADPAKVRQLMGVTYKDGLLTIKPNTPKEAAKAKAKAPAAGDQALPAEAVAQMKQMLGEMKVSIKLVIESGIAETSASHRKDNTITLLALDMQEALKNEANIKKLGAVDQNNPAAGPAALNTLEGIKMETKPEITVKLK